jgi:hypothetical protein
MTIYFSLEKSLLLSKKSGIKRPPPNRIDIIIELVQEVKSLIG